MLRGLFLKLKNASIRRTYQWIQTVASQGPNKIRAACRYCCRTRVVCKAPATTETVTDGWSASSCLAGLSSLPYGIPPRACSGRRSTALGLAFWPPKGCPETRWSEPTAATRALPVSRSRRRAAGTRWPRRAAIPLWPSSRTT